MSKHERSGRALGRNLDPDILFSSARRSRRPHKDLQAARVAERALLFALTEGPDPILAEVEVLEVRPEPTAARLRVILGVDHRACTEELRPALERAQGRLRSAVAEALDRKKAPTLVFDLVPKEAP